MHLKLQQQGSAFSLGDGPEPMASQKPVLYVNGHELAESLYVDGDVTWVDCQKVTKALGGFVNADVGTGLLELLPPKAGATGSGSVEVLKNGNLMQAPPPQGLPGMQEHAGAFYVPVPPGSKIISGWTVTGGPVRFLYWKRSPNFNTVTPLGGCISQTVDTVPDHFYQVAFTVYLDEEGSADQSVVLRAAGTSTTIAIKTGDSGNTRRYWIFRAASPRTTFEVLSTAANNGGPFVTNFSITEFPPKP